MLKCPIQDQGGLVRVGVDQRLQTLRDHQRIALQDLLQGLLQFLAEHLFLRERRCRQRGRSDERCTQHQKEGKNPALADTAHGGLQGEKRRAQVQSKKQRRQKNISRPALVSPALRLAIKLTLSERRA